MNAAMVHLKPFFESGEVELKGDFIIGMVTGDLQDSGKIFNLNIAEKGVMSVERLSHRTGKWHGLYNEISVDANSDMPNDKPAVFHLNSVSIFPLK